MNSNSWYKQIMKLTFPTTVYVDLGKLLLIYFCLEEKLFNRTFTKRYFATYLYRFYIDNGVYAEIHPNNIIRNIHKYSINDLLPVVDIILNDWRNDNKEHNIECSNNEIFISITDLTDLTYKQTKSIVDISFKKRTGNSFLYNSNLVELEELKSYDIIELNKSRLKNRVIEDMNYCICCDEIDDLYIVNLSDNIEYILEPENYITLCKEHYNLYNQNYFVFSENGYIKILQEHKLLDGRMRISHKYLNKKRKIILKHSND